MSVVGINIGEHSTYIAVARQGGVEIISNDYSQRNTPTVVALGGRQRCMGVTAENQRNLNVKNTVSYFKNFVGRSYQDEYVEKHRHEIGADVVELDDGGIGFHISGKTYRPEQILAMIFTKVRDIVRSSEGTDITACVVSVPTDFTEAQIAAVKAAARIAKLNNIQIISDTAALATAYARTKTDLASEEDNPRTVVFVDCGSASLQASVVTISGDTAEVLGTCSNTRTGGKYFDEALLNYFIEEIEEKYRCQIRNNKKALNKLRIGVEKMKKQMSANSSKLPLQIDSLVEDLDINIGIERNIFEGLIETHLSEIKKTFTDLLISTGLEKMNVHSVEIVGGSTRIPAIKKIIEEVFEASPSSSLNADEAVAKGCCFQSAAISDKFLTKSFVIKDEKEDNDIETFPGLDQHTVSQLAEAETQMVKDDINEIRRQEAKNVLEEQLYTYRAVVTENSEDIEEDDELAEIQEYFRSTEDWLYEEGEEASEQKYAEMLREMKDKFATFQQWREMKMNAIKDRKRMMEDNTQESCQNSPYQGINHSKIPKDPEQYDDDSQMYYSPRYYRRPARDCRARSSWSSPMFQDPFSRQGSVPFGRSPYLQRSLFGW